MGPGCLGATAHAVNIEAAAHEMTQRMNWMGMRAKLQSKRGEDCGEISAINESVVIDVATWI